MGLFANVRSRLHELSANVKLRNKCCVPHSQLWHHESAKQVQASAPSFCFGIWRAADAGSGAQPVRKPLPITLVRAIGVGGNVGGSCGCLTPRPPILLSFHFEGTHKQQRLFKLQELYAIATSNVTSAQPVAPSLPPHVLVHGARGRRNVRWARTTLAPQLPFAITTQPERAGKFQRALKRQEFFILPATDVAGP